MGVLGPLLPIIIWIVFRMSCMYGWVIWLGQGYEWSVGWGVVAKLIGLGDMA